MKQKLRTKSNSIRNQWELANLKRLGEARYKYSATLEEHTCAICGALDGKTFDIEDAKLGINLPPMHDKCRCYIGLESTPHQLTRWARNPITHKSEHVPANMTYAEWIKQYE